MLFSQAHNEGDSDDSICFLVVIRDPEVLVRQQIENGRRAFADCTDNGQRRGVLVSELFPQAPDDRI